MALSMLASIGFLIIIMLQIKVGLGRQLTFPEVPGFLQALWATIPVYNLALILCKLSITVQCCRVLRTPKMQRFFRTYFVFLAVYGLWTLFSSIMTCWPIEVYWLAIAGAQGVCLNKGALTFSNAGINIATDLILIVVPVPLLWRLQIPKKQKIILMGLFCVGTLAVVTSIIRLQSLYMIAIAPEAEQSVMGVSIAIWSCIEINTAIICASIPAIKPLFVKAFPTVLLSSLYGRTKGAAYATRSAGKDGHPNKSSASRANGSALRSSTRNAIQVERSFEMRSVPVLVGGEDEIKSSSRDGSEKNLVASSWQDEYYAGQKGPGQKRVTITSHPGDMV
ncbi:hypothetical protein B0H67DRAFT_582507 [Lasiosphaeris hirsuta]|uniref:Rhodopsin domain-containing protein n=1 Tax=Lasiosphaeris hirsuta TaxID=260670 RepID=A0AA40AHY1_9PEZI|nr:hypothetical protein B0H67DRAFT_582507 [Lasiosphaeris hirsuta]